MKKIKINFYSLGLGFVFFIFGLWQIINPSYWFYYLPLELNLNTKFFFYLNGLFNLIVGLGLILNLSPLIFSFLAIIHLTGVILTINFSDITVRNIGLLIIALSLFLNNLSKK